MIDKIRKLIREGNIKLGLQLILSSNQSDVLMFLLSLCNYKNKLTLMENLEQLFKLSMSDNTFFIESNRDSHDNIYGLADTMYISNLYPTGDVILHNIDNIKFDSCEFNGKKLLGSCNKLTLVDQNFNGFPNIDELTLSELRFHGYSGRVANKHIANGRFVDTISLVSNRNVIRCKNLSCNHLNIDNNSCHNMFLDDHVPIVHDTINFVRFDQNIKKLFNNNPNSRFLYYDNYISKSEMKSRIKYAVR